MRTLRTSRRSASAGAPLFAAAPVVAALAGASGSSAAARAITPHPISVRPLISKPQSPRPGTLLFSCQNTPLNRSDSPRCYIPQEIQTAYGYSGLLASGVNGNGRTMVIIDAFSNPYVAHDLEFQDKTFGLPAPPSFTAIAP